MGDIGQKQPQGRQLFSLKQRLLHALSLGHLVAQCVVGLLELPGALSHALLQARRECVQRFLRLFALCDIGIHADPAVDYPFRVA